MPRYPLDGAARLQAHLRARHGPHEHRRVAPPTSQVVGVDATAATAAQWAVIQQLQSRLPDADVTLREHRLSWRRDPALPGADRVWRARDAPGRAIHPAARVRRA